MARVRRTVGASHRKPTRIVLALVGCSADSTKLYEIALDRHNTVYCTCKGWRYNGHRCSHLTAFRRALVEAA